MISIYKIVYFYIACWLIHVGESIPARLLYNLDFIEAGWLGCSGLNHGTRVRWLWVQMSMPRWCYDHSLPNYGKGSWELVVWVPKKTLGDYMSDVFKVQCVKKCLPSKGKSSSRFIILCPRLVNGMNKH